MIRRGDFRQRLTARDAVLRGVAVRLLWSVPCLWLTGMLGPWANCSGAVETARQRYLIDVWRGEHGLPQSTVTGISQTPDGFLWISTLDGLARFDGLHFKMFRAGNTPALGTGRIRFLFPDGPGAFWLAIQEGDVVRFDGARFERLPLPAGDGSRPTSIQVVKDSDGALWLSTEDGKVSWLFNGQYSVVSTNWDPTGRLTFQVRADAEGRLWAISRSGLFRVGHEQLIPALQGKAGEHIVHCASRRGGWWISTGTQLRLWREGQWVATAAAPTNAPANFRCALEDSGGYLWLGSVDQGLFRCGTNGTLLQFTRQDGLGSDFVRVLFEDTEANLWVGTEGGGLNRLRASLFNVYGPDQGVPADLATTVSAGRTGEIWVGTDGAGMRRLQGDLASPVSEDPNAPPLHAMTVLADSHGRVWLGTRAGGLYRFYAGEMTRVGGSLPPGLFARSLFEDRHGVVWAGWRNTTNLLRIERDTVSTFPLPADLPPVDVRVMADDATDSLWIGTDGHGLLRWRQGQFTRFTRDNGLGSDFIWAIHAEPDGAIWIGTYGGGLTRLKDGRTAVCTMRQGLPDDVISHIADDGHGQYWFSSNQGIFRASKRELNEFAEGRRERVHCVSYGTADGLPTLQCRGGFQPSASRSLDGRLWFLTFGGLVAVSPAAVSLSTAPPRVYLDELRVDGSATDLREWQREQSRQNSAGTVAAGVLELRPGSQRFEFRYTALDFASPEKLRFRHRLEGVDAGWVDSGGQRAVSYTRLSRGTYTFHVQAGNREGVWSEPGAAMAFTILPFFWQTWWFTLLFLLTFGGLVGAVVGSLVRRRHQRHLQLLERLHAAERERTRIARDIHDDLGSSLTEIGYLGALGMRDARTLEDAHLQLRRIMDRARELAGKVDETVWAVNPKNDSPDHLATYLCHYAREFLETADVRCRLDVAVNLPEVELTTEARHNVFLTVKEALNNAVRHARATEVSLRLAVADNVMVIEVADNGCGFNPGAVGEAGNGLRNMAARMQEIGGRFEVRSTPGSGAVIHLRLPLRPGASAPLQDWTQPLHLRDATGGGNR